MKYLFILSALAMFGQPEIGKKSKFFLAIPALNNVMGHLGRAQSFADKASYPRSVNTDGTIKRVTASDWTSGRCSQLPGPIEN